MSAPLLSACGSGVERTSTVAQVHPWNGFAGVGDYARSNGNIEGVREAAHLIRDQKIDDMAADLIDTGEVYDLVIIGGGFSGLSAARTFLKEADPHKTCLLLENHPLPGGEAKRNEFLVDGKMIVGPQGSNVVVTPAVQGDWYDELWKNLGIPRDPKFQPLENHAGELRVSKTNYLPMFGLAEQTATCGYFFDENSFGVEPRWDIDSSESNYTNTPFTDEEKADLTRLHRGAGKNIWGDDWEKSLDSVTYRNYLEEVLEVQPRIIAMLDKTLSTTGGLGADAVSALFAMKSGLPGFDTGFGEGSLYRLNPADKEASGIFSFPGGNDTVYRLMLKRALPEAIAGDDSFEAIQNSKYQFENFDRESARFRIRLNATAVFVRHDGEPESASLVKIAYVRDGKFCLIRARGVVSAIGGWVNKHIVRDLPDDYQDAFGQFVYGSNMIVNVALRNWKFLARIGVTACHYFSAEGLGGFCNIKQPMAFSDKQAAFDPAEPAVLTFYVGFPNPGLPAQAQAAQNRYSLLSKSYAEIEGAIRAQMTKMFSSAGFDADRDIAGIVVNRWGHSYIVPTPGFFFGADGQRPAMDIVKERF
ncbi:MAG: FAD/NAD(P)-binding protein, partial [Pseudomonadota bacterium]